MSCTNNNSVLPDSLNVVKELSIIEEAEKSGIKLFKKEVEIFDAKKSNSVKVMIANADERFLNDYLKSDFILVLNEITDKPAESQKSDLSQSTQISFDNATYHVYTELKFSEKVTSYGIKVNVKMTNSQTKNLRAPAGYSVSDLWESGLHAASVTTKWLNTSNSNNGIYYAARYKDCGICGWSSIMKEGPLSASDPQATYSKDARKLCVNILSNWYNGRADFVYQP